MINPPQAAILAVGAIEEKAVVREGQIVIRPQLTLSLSADHRMVDGALAAQFLARVRELLESPYLMLISG
nr:2-oxo acid dehydrogenase subunit E2 [Candidatus Hakubella thermalkaliphila]